MNDPIKHCQVYKEIGCAHVDGYLCDFPDCSIMKEYIMKEHTMNDLIKALAEQASHQSPDGYPVTIPYSDDFVNKFAELIIQEMCQVMKAEGEQFSLDQNFDALKGVGRCMRRVKEHFGVDR